MKVAFISYAFGEYCVRLASAVSREAEVCLLLANQVANPYLSHLSPTVNFRPFNRPRLRQPFQQMRTVYTILRHLRAFQPDVIHIQHGHLWFNFALPLLQCYPLVLTVHDPRHHLGDHEGANTPQRIIDFGFSRARQLIVHNTAMEQVLINELHLPAKNIHIVPHIALGDDTAYSQVSEDDQLILFFGRIWKYKGLEYLIRAEPLITAQQPNARILIAGRGENFAPYQRMMVHPKNFIVYNNYIPDAEIAALFRRTSVVVLPYLEATQSGVIPTAYTYAKPVVATTVGGLPEQVEHGTTGLLVPPGDEKELADAILSLLKDKRLRHQLGANGKRKLETEWSPEVVAQKTISVYHQAIDDFNQAVAKKKK